MIALLRGILIEKHPNQAIVETGGVGYDVTIPVSTFTHLPDPGTEVRLRILSRSLLPIPPSIFQRTALSFTAWSGCAFGLILMWNLSRFLQPPVAA